jgi:hypothetical protein
MVRTGTNGFMLRHPERLGWQRRVTGLAEQLADSGLRNLWISLDSASPEIHEQARGLPGVWRGIEAALPLFHERGLYPAANLGLNRRTGGFWLHPPEADTPAAHQAFEARARLALRAFFGRVIDMGFTMVNLCYPMSMAASGLDDARAAYAATSNAQLVCFTPVEKALLFRALHRVIPEVRHRIRVFTPRCALRALIAQHAEGTPPWYPCRGGVDFFFVEAGTGITYPCGFRAGEPLGRFWEVDLRAHRAPPSCVACDWECFRDPSTLLGPLLDVGHDPSRLLRAALGSDAATAEWREDLRYHRACNHFDGRTPPDQGRLAAFAPPQRGILHAC